MTSNSAWQIVADTSHDIEIDQPHAVIDAIHQVFDAVQTHTVFTGKDAS